MLICANNYDHFHLKNRTKDLDKKNDRFRLNGKMMWVRESERKKGREKKEKKEVKGQG